MDPHPLLGKKELTVRIGDPSFFQWTSRVLLEWCGVVGCLAAAPYARGVIGWAGYVLAAYAIGVFQHRLSVLGHEGSHRHISKTRWLNDVMANLFVWWPLVLGGETFRHQHLDHHSFLATPKDPENWYEAWHGTFGLPRARRWFAKRVFLIVFFGFGLKSVLQAAWAYQPRTVRDWVERTLFWGAVVAGLWLTGNLWVLGVYFLAYLTTFWAASWVRWWSEHQGTDDTNRIVAPLWQRLTIYPHNTYCHFEHHYWPLVPSWHLPELRARYDGPETFVTLSDLLTRWEQSGPYVGGAAHHPYTGTAKNRYTVTPPGMPLPT